MVALLATISDLAAQTGSVRIRVTDWQAARVVGSSAALLGSNGKPTRTVQSNVAGEIVFSDLPMGNYRIVVSANGFKKQRVKVTLPSSEEKLVEVRLDVCPGILVTCN